MPSYPVSGTGRHRTGPLGEEKKYFYESEGCLAYPTSLSTKGLSGKSSMKAVPAEPMAFFWLTCRIATPHKHTNRRVRAPTAPACPPLLLPPPPLSDGEGPAFDLRPTHARTLQPAALAVVSYGQLFYQVRILTCEFKKRQRRANPLPPAFPPRPCAPRPRRCSLLSAVSA